MYFGKGIVMLFVHFLYYLCSLLSGSLFFVSFFYFITDKPLRHFLFDDRGKGKYSNQKETKYLDVFLRLFQGFSVFFFRASWPGWALWCCRLTMGLPAYQLIIPGTVAFFWFLLSSGGALAQLARSASSCFFIVLYCKASHSTPHFFFTTSII